jgi:hypothetical protein
MSSPAQSQIRSVVSRGVITTISRVAGVLSWVEARNAKELSRPGAGRLDIRRIESLWQLCTPIGYRLLDHAPNAQEGDMPRPLRFKMFMGDKPTAIEEQINAWLNDLGSAAIIKTDTMVAAIAEKPSSGAYPCIVVSVWYEPPERN